MGLPLALGLAGGMLLGGFASGIFGKKAAEEQAEAYTGAAATAAGATETAAATQWRMFKRGLKETAPWRRVGRRALPRLEELIYGGPGEFEESPGYQFRLQEGINTLQRGAAARGNLLSGATQKALVGFGQDYATSEYDNFLRRYYESQQPLFGLAGMGGTTAAQTAGMAQQTGANIGQMQMQGGNLLAQGQMGAGMAGASAYGHYGNILNQGISNMMLLGLYGDQQGWWS